MDGLMKVPDSWSAKSDNAKVYTDQGVATYRLRLQYPNSYSDPALRIQNIACAYKVFINGNLAGENGIVSRDRNVFKEGTKTLILPLPRIHEKEEEQEEEDLEVEILFQVANLNYAKGGMRQSPIFGSLKVLEREHVILNAFQLLYRRCSPIWGLLSTALCPPIPE